jgi:DNA-binding NarL/FixJ family response regulator
MNVLIVDDHPMVLEYLSGAVGKALPDAIVRTAGDLPAALEAAQDGRADMVLLDLGLPGCGGIESLLRFRKAFPAVRVVVVSAEDDYDSIRGALAAGAAGYIPKTSDPKVVVSALRLVAEGGRYVPAEALDSEPKRADVRTCRRAGMAREPESHLTERQRDVLTRLLKGRTIGQIAQDLGIAEATAKHHALAVYAAYGVSSRADLLVTAPRRGAGNG